MNARRSFCRRRLSLAAIVAALLSGAIVRADAPSYAQLARGKDLFTRAWSRGDALSPKGDGLGPLFNADSCVACHAQGGVGGAGPNSVKDQLLT